MSQQQQVGVKKFHVENLQPNSLVLLIGQTDKLTFQIVEALQGAKDGLIIDGGAVPDSEDLVTELVRDHLKQQKERLNTGDPTPSYLVLENLDVEPAFWKLLNIILRNRNTLHDTIFLGSDFTKIPDSVLIEADYIVISGGLDADKLEQIHSTFGTDAFKTFKTFEAVYNQVACDNDCLVLDFTVPKITMQNSVFYYQVV